MSSSLPRSAEIQARTSSRRGVAVERRLGEAQQPVEHGRRAAGVDVVDPRLGDQRRRPRRTRAPRRRGGSPRRSCRIRRATRTRAGAGPARRSGSRRSSSTRRSWANRWWKRNQRRWSSSGSRNRFERASDSSAAAEPLPPSTASHSGTHSRSSTDGPEHERLQLRLVGAEHLAREEVDDVRAGAVEGPHQPGLVRLARQRQRGQVDPGRPALGARDEQVDVGGGEAEPEAAVEELVRLGPREAQVVRAQLEQLAVGAQRAQRQRRVGAGREHELERRGHVVDEPREALARGGAGEPVEVVEHEHELALLGQRVHEPRQHHLEQRRGGDQLGRDRLRERRARAAERLDHVRPQHDRVVVAPVERDPRHGPLARLFLPPRGQQRRLAEPGRARDEAELQAAPSRSRANSRSRAIVCAGTEGGWSLVTSRTGVSGRPADVMSLRYGRVNHRDRGKAVDALEVVLLRVAHDRVRALWCAGACASRRRCGGARPRSPSAARRSRTSCRSA